MNKYGVNKDKKVSDDGETRLCTAEEFTTAMCEDNDTVMMNRLYSMDGEKVEDNDNDICDPYFYSSFPIDVVDYVFPQCDLQHRVDLLMSQN